MYFKPNPKAQVELKFQELFGRKLKVKVTGARAPAPGRLYNTTLMVEGRVVASASHRDWRKSYNLLRIEVEKLFADGKFIEA